MTCSLVFIRPRKMTTIDIPAILARLYDKCDKPTGRYGCILWRGATYDGLYGKMRNPMSSLYDQPRYIRVHRLVYLLHNISDFKSLKLPREDSAGNPLDVSHICHNSLCVNISHLVLEPHYINCSRKDCIRYGRCENHAPACLLGMLIGEINNSIQYYSIVNNLLTIAINISSFS